MAAKATFEWSISPTVLADALGGYQQNLTAGLAQKTEEIAGQAEGWMKQNAPWSDETGAARAGLTADARIEGDTFAIDCAHGVDYGPYLEFGTSRMAPRPILGPAVDRFGNVLMAAAAELLGE